MVEAAQARQRNQTGVRRWPWLDRASIGRVFVQRVVNAIRKDFSQLLDDPIGRWMPRNVAVENPAALVLDDEETVATLEKSRSAR